MRRFAATFLSAYAVILALLLAVPGGILAEMALEAINARTGNQPQLLWSPTKWYYAEIVLAATMLSGFIAIYLLAYLRRSIFTLRASLRRNAENKGRKLLIMGLSHAESVVDADGGTSPAAQAMMDALTAAGFKSASSSVEEMCSKGLLTLNQFGRPERTSPGAFTWVQNLRALRPHVESHTLRAVVIVPSKGTLEQAPICKQFIDHILSKSGYDGVLVLVAEESPDYSQFEDVRNALLAARDFAKTICRNQIREKIRDRDICIDATSGTAAFSIAAGIVTLNHDMTYSYVTTFENADTTRGMTSPRGGVVRTYDAVVDISAFVENT